MKLVKRLVIVVVLLVVVLIVGAFVGLYFINDLVKVGVEKGGTYAMGVKTSLGSADVGVLSGKAGLKELAVANPDGFKGGQFFGLGLAVVEVSLSSLQSDVVEVPKLELSGVRASLEKKDGKTNYKVILDNLAKLKTGKADAPQPAREGKKFVIKELTIKDVRVSVDLLDSPVPLGSIVVPIESIHLTDLGTAGKGLPLSDIAAIVVRAVLATAVENGNGLIPADILGDLQGQLAVLGNLDQLGVKVDAVVGKELGKAVEQAKAEADKAVNKAKDEVGKQLDNGIKDIFGPKK